MSAMQQLAKEPGKSELLWAAPPAQKPGVQRRALGMTRSDRRKLTSVAFGATFVAVAGVAGVTLCTFFSQARVLEL